VEAIARETHDARRKVARAVYHHLHAQRYRTELAEDILARVPRELEGLTRAVVLEACRQFGFEMESKGGAAQWYLEFGSEATVETLHGVAPGNRYLGTFDREEAVAKESLDFFASGHPLVEGILAELADGTRGQVILAEVPGSKSPGVGVVLVLRDGVGFRFLALDLDGRERPEWVSGLLEARTVREIPGTAWTVPDWRDRVRALLAEHVEKGRLLAACGVRFVAG
jgi:ATP-dependent helicase HepA